MKPCEKDGSNNVVLELAVKPFTTHNTGQLLALTAEHYIRYHKYTYLVYVL